MSSVGTRKGCAVALEAWFSFLARAGRIFASKEQCWDDVHILRRGDVVLFRGSTEFD